MEFQELIAQGNMFSPIVNSIRPFTALGFAISACLLIAGSFLQFKNFVKLLTLFIAVGLGTVMVTKAGELASKNTQGAQVTGCQKLDQFEYRTSDGRIEIYEAPLSLCNGWPVADAKNSIVAKWAQHTPSPEESRLILSIGVLLMFINLTVNVPKGSMQIFLAFFSAALLMTILVYRYSISALGNNLVAQVITSFLTMLGWDDYTTTMETFSKLLIQLHLEAENAKVLKIGSYNISMGVGESISLYSGKFSGLMVNIYSGIFVGLQMVGLSALVLISGYYIVTGEFSPLKLIPVILRLCFLSVFQIPLVLCIKLSNSLGSGWAGFGVVVLFLFLGGMLYLFKDKLLTMFDILRGTRSMTSIRVAKD